MSNNRNHILQDPDTHLYIINIDGDVYHTNTTEKFERRKFWNNPNTGEIRAQIAGTIRQFFVAPEAIVKRGDKVLILEAMKMHNEILSPVDGIVKEICASIGQNVAKGDLLIKIESK
ncbi:MAG: acetyl-CoA carboxylase biotin carboxyl carrier protein subunit [Bacteroidales bacterium]|nr:acetyl-CoA carboxylase biotin carboxyl carrier protein subunit [Bacteroidales bacterium]